jgi:ketohexokinase
MAHILGIGNVTLDIIHHVDAYPHENAEIRCSNREHRRGGNTANLLVVLAGLGHACSFAGVLAGDSAGRQVSADLLDNGIDIAPCRTCDSGSMPVSSVLLSAATGSRTIVHYRDLPEFSPADFTALDVQPFDWLHFEGRNIAALQAMLHHSREHYPAIPRSLEVEKTRDGIEDLFGLADVLLFSEDYACQRGYEQPERLLQAIHADHPAAVACCTRGADGAVAIDHRGRVFRHPGAAPGKVIDTLGAGDTFNAAIINGSLAGLGMAAILEQACMLAGRKCTRDGFT